MHCLNSLILAVLSRRDDRRAYFHLFIFYYPTTFPPRYFHDLCIAILLTYVFSYAFPTAVSFSSMISSLLAL